MDAGVKIFAFRIVANTRAQNGRGNSDFFILMSALDVKNLNLPPSVPRHCICGDRKDNNSNLGILHPSIRERFDGRWMPAFRFLTRSLANWVKNLNTGVRCPSKLPLIDRRQKLANCCLLDCRKYDGGERKRAKFSSLFFTSAYVRRRHQEKN